MWPLSLVLLFATAAPPQQNANPTTEELQRRNQQLELSYHRLMEPMRGLTTTYQAQEEAQKDVCFTMRSYYFHRQDGQAPVLVGTSTCTPATKFQQRQVKPQPGSGFVPLRLQLPDQTPPE